jgi:hypothetical protein
MKHLNTLKRLFRNDDKISPVKKTHPLQNKTYSTLKMEAGFCQNFRFTHLPDYTASHPKHP